MSHVLSNKNKKLFFVDLDGILITSRTSETRTIQKYDPQHDGITDQHLANSGKTIIARTHRHTAEGKII